MLLKNFPKLFSDISDLNSDLNFSDISVFESGSSRLAVGAKDDCLGREDIHLVRVRKCAIRPAEDLR